jgi:hypothetical protein
MARLLLKLGATASQADAEGYTAFQRYAEKAETDIMEVLISDDKTGVKNAINHLVVKGWAWRPETLAPLHSAIERGDTILVLQLLNNGANAHIDFDTWLKAAKVSSITNLLGSMDQNQKKYQESVEQPIMAALRRGDAETVIELLKRGADPNVMTRDTAELMSNEYRRRYTKGKLALDVVRRLVSRLEELRGKKATQKSAPQLQPGMQEFLSQYKEGTYQHWLVAEEVESKTKSHKKWLESYRETEAHDKRVAEEYEEALDELVAQFSAVEEALLAHGAKTFEDVYPDIKTGEDSYYNRSSLGDAEEKTPKPYKYTFVFSDENDITERRHEGYIKL